MGVWIAYVTKLASMSDTICMYRYIFLYVGIPFVVTPKGRYVYSFKVVFLLENFGNVLATTKRIMSFKRESNIVKLHGLIYHNLHINSLRSCGTFIYRMILSAK